MKRKYDGVPTQKEVIEQYNELKEIVSNITTLEQINKLIEQNKADNRFMDIEINYDIIRAYNNEPITIIRYEYKNILVYYNIKDNMAIADGYVTVYSDEDGMQFTDCKYDDFDQEVERCNKMGLLLTA